MAGKRTVHVDGRGRVTIEGGRGLPTGHLGGTAGRPELPSVRAAADRYVDARFELVAEIRAASKQGRSLRDIAQATGIYSHEQVRRLIGSARKR